LVADHPLIARGLVQRVGSRVTEELPAPMHELFVPSAIVSRLREENDTVAAWLRDERASALRAGHFADVAALDAELAEIAMDLTRIGDELTRHCRVTVTPIANVYLSPALWREYDAVVCDEASMVALPALYLAAGLARTRIVVAGDFQHWVRSPRRTRLRFAPGSRGTRSASPGSRRWSRPARRRLT
jgi:hypothetical protein